MFHLRDLVVFTVCFSLISSLQWTSTLKDGQVIYACSGQDVTIPWSFSLSPDEEINSMEWLYRGESQEMVAMFSHGTFLPLPAFSQRVQYVANGGLVLNHVTPGDDGNYSIDLDTVTSAGVFSAKYHTITVEVFDSLPTTDGQLHVTLQPGATLDSSSQQWSIVLTCGSFTSTDQPPFPVEWVTPSGQVLDSSGYNQGQFELHMTTPVTWGSYACRIPEEHWASSCPYNNQSGSEASVEIDGMAASVMLLSAELNGLKQTNSEQAEMIASLTNLTQTQREAINQLEAQLQSQQDMFDILFRTSGPCSPINYTVMDDHRRDVNYGVANHTCDNHLTAGWYRFLLNGTNAVMPTSCVEKQHCNTDITIWLDLQGQSLPSTPGTEITVRGCGSYTTGCCMYQTPPVTVRHCGDFFVYHLQPYTNICYSSYCAQAGH